MTSGIPLDLQIHTQRTTRITAQLPPQRVEHHFTTPADVPAVTVHIDVAASESASYEHQHAAVDNMLALLREVYDAGITDPAALRFRLRASGFFQLEPRPSTLELADAAAGGRETT